MTWALDGSGEREFASTGPTVDLTGIITAGGGTDNNDYLFIVALAIQGTDSDSYWCPKTLH